MGFIRLDKIQLAPPTLSESKTVIVSHRLTADPDIPENYEIDTDNLVVPVGGELEEPFIVDDLNDAEEYTVKVTSDCGNFFYKANFRTGYDCPSFVAGSLQGLAMQSIPYQKCDECAPVLNGVPAGQISSMTAGALTSGTCNITDYVIDWYLDEAEEPAFTSGSDETLNEDITVEHPFAGEPVEGGTWHPKIRFIEIDGERFSSDITEGVKWSPDLEDCLPTITVQNLSCSNGGAVQSYDGRNYSHKIVYTNSVNSPTLSSRSVRFTLDAVNKYFAWLFRGMTIADTIEIYYISPSNASSTLLKRWKIGIDAGTSNVTIVDKVTGNYDNVRMVEPLTAFTYANGDYLRIDITPNENANTNWEFCCKCFSAIDCTLWDATQRNVLSTPTLTWDGVNCDWIAEYTKAVFPLGADFLFYYHSGTSAFGGASAGAWYDNKVQIRLSQKTNAYPTYHYNHYGCAALVGTAQVTKTDTQLIFVFSNVTDYNKYKADWAQAVASAYMTDYSADPTNYKHYKYWSVRHVMGASCGDSLLYYNYYFHYEIQPVFNDATKTVTWTHGTKVNGFAATPACEFTDVAVAGMVNSGNSFPTGAGNNYVHTTNVGAGTYFLSGIFLTQQVINETAKNAYLGMWFTKVDICDMAAKGFTHEMNPAWDWEFIFVYDDVTITNNSDPVNNWKWFRKFNPTTGARITNPADYIKIYEIVGGVVIP